MCRKRKLKKSMKIGATCCHLRPKLVAERGLNVRLGICIVILVLFWLGMASTEEKDLADWRAEDGKIDRHVVSELKKQKAICKSAFTKSKNRPVSATYSEEIDRKEIRQLQTALDKAQDKIIDALEKLCTAYIELSDHENEQLIQGEMELIDTEYNAAHKKAFECLEISKSSSSLDQTHTSNDQHKIELGKDMWKQMKRVTIPVFDGSKKKYESWKASFMACIDIVL